MSTILILVSQVVIHVLEARHDYYVIKGADHGKVYENRAWHEQDSVLWFFLYLLMAYMGDNVGFLFTGLSARLLVLQLALNDLRGLPYAYLSNKGIDGFFKQYFGLRWSLVVKSIIFLMFCCLAMLNK
jgi:hypothetical protein